MRRLFYIILLLTACDYSNSLHPVCPQECYTGPDNTSGIGICRVGHTGCDEDGYPTDECIGEVLPEWSETCDGLDNDCNGKTDESYWSDIPLIDYSVTNICKREGVCLYTATAHCIGGDWVCQYPDTYEEEETRCDNLDNDCDGLVDEYIFANSEREFCYTGQIGTEFHTPCHPGILGCENGQIRCLNQVIPRPEMCNAIDDDCNGFIDDTGYNESKYDIVIALDKSGSMDGDIEAVRLALGEYINLFTGNLNVKFAVISMSGLGGNVVKIRDFSDILEIIPALASSSNSSNSEGSFDAIYEVCDLSNNVLGLSWRDDAWPIYLGFTDEPGQSFYTPKLTQNDLAQVTADGASGICVENGVMIYQWSDHEQDFSEVCSLTGGEHFYLTPSVTAMFNNLNTIMSVLCVDE